MKRGRHFLRSLFWLRFFLIDLAFVGGAGGMENVQECRQHDKGEHESENTIMDENELPRRQQCGVCGGIDGHNKRTCPQLRNLLGQTLLGGGMPTVQEMPQSESAMRR